MKVKTLILIIVVTLASFSAGFFIKKSIGSFNSTVGWPSMQNAGVTFHYPSALSTIYTTAVDWPPKLNIYDSKLVCTEAGKETERVGITEKKTINRQEYCVTRVVEGAAGSTYTQYAYAKSVGKSTAIMTFTTRTPQCENYDDPKKTDCKNERDTFDLDSLVDTIFSTIKFD